MRLGAFLITFNRPERLREAIAATFAQSLPPEILIVVDNGDPRPTEEVLDSFGDPRIRHHAFHDNRGPAGASAWALERLVDEGYDWICWGDDDTAPIADDVFERLLALPGREAEPDGVGGMGGVGARFDWRRGELARVPDAELRGVVDVDSIGSGHQLITHRRAVEAAGLPNARLFFGFYDPEYCLRVRRAGLRLLVDGELMLRYRQRAGRLNLSLRRSIVPRTPHHGLWRRYYVTRNYIHMMRRTFDRPDLARREAGKALARAAVSWLRGPRYGWSFSRRQIPGVFDGYRDRLGRTVPPDPKPQEPER